MSDRTVTNEATYSDHELMKAYKNRGNDIVILELEVERLKNDNEYLHESRDNLRKELDNMRTAHDVATQLGKCPHLKSDSQM